MTTHFTEDHRNSPLDRQRTKDPVSQRVIKLLQVHKRKHGRDATRISFSEEGYCEARREAGDNFAGEDADGCITTYMGIPFCVQAGQLAPIRVQHIQSTAPNSISVKLEYSAASGHILVDGKPYGEPISVLQIAGASLTAAQLCDIIRAWLDSDDAAHCGTFEKELDRVVVEHGCFE